MTVAVKLALLGGLALLLLSLGTWILLRVRMTPAERERRRRMLVNRTGRMGDGILTDIQDDTLYFSYSVGGVTYTASQDVRALRDRMPAAMDGLIGPVTLKYSPRNPANSILVCEAWSGLWDKNQTANSSRS